MVAHPCYGNCGAKDVEWRVTAIVHQGPREDTGGTAYSCLWCFERVFGMLGGDAFRIERIETQS